MKTADGIKLKKVSDAGSCYECFFFDDGNEICHKPLSDEWRGCSNGDYIWVKKKKKKHLCKTCGKNVCIPYVRLHTIKEDYKVKTKVTSCPNYWKREK